MPPFLRLGLVLVALSGCAAQSTTPSPAATTTAANPPALRPDLTNPWVEAGGKINWPQHDGFNATPVLMVLPPGLLMDRFGSDGGRFFSPKGAGYRARALPYVCASLVYRVYRLDRPLLAWTGAASPWFGEPGGATQIETDATAAQLLSDGVIVPVSDPGPSPCPKA